MSRISEGIMAIVLILSLFAVGWAWGFVLGIEHHQRMCVIVGVAEYKADERGFARFEWIVKGNE